ncbi:MAG: ABC transporter permease [Pseudomonadales bacterium]|nr:ABC transporter permease [Pseudomonadales bacterium]
MSSSLVNITLPQLVIAALPVVPVVVLLVKWQLAWGRAIHALLRMLAQLLLVGYVLTFIFDASDWRLVIGVLGVMAFTASWISVSAASEKRRAIYPAAFASLLLTCGFMIALITQGVLEATPWYDPKVIIPLSGMIFSNAMNGVSLAAERLISELDNSEPFEVARGKALSAALIPVVNGLFAVGLVSLPGMMTGQILSGVSPLIAARYQIVVMCMLFATTGVSSAMFLVLVRRALGGATTSL